MREIRFRAWDKRKHNWLTKDPYWCVSSDGKFCWGDDGGGFYESEDCELVEYTGLKDKNGQEIYEGDILKTLDGKIGRVAYNDTCYHLIYTSDNFYSSDDMDFLGDVITPEITGNIFETPELMER